MLKQRTSYYKQFGQSARQQFQLIHLGVFPFKVEVKKPSPHPTYFYFEKGSQIIGNNGQHIFSIPPVQNHKQIYLDDPSLLIAFRLYSLENVSYKWSLYHQEEQTMTFKESSSFSLRQVVREVVKDAGSASSLQQALLKSFKQCEQKVQFPQVGIVLHFLIIVSNDSKKIEEEIRFKYGPKEQQANLSQLNFNTTAIEITSKQPSVKNTVKNSQIFQPHQSSFKMSNAKQSVLKIKDENLSLKAKGSSAQPQGSVKNTQDQTKSKQEGQYQNVVLQQVPEQQLPGQLPANQSAIVSKDAIIVQVQDGQQVNNQEMINQQKQYAKRGQTNTEQYRRQIILHNHSYPGRLQGSNLRPITQEASHEELTELQQQQVQPQAKVVPQKSEAFNDQTQQTEKPNIKKSFLIVLALFLLIGTLLIVLPGQKKIKKKKK